MAYTNQIDYAFFMKIPRWIGMEWVVNKAKQSKAHQTIVWVCLSVRACGIQRFLSLSLSVALRMCALRNIIYLYYICVFVTFSINAAIMCVISCLEYQVTQKQSSFAYYLFVLSCFIFIFFFCFTSSLCFVFCRMMANLFILIVNVLFLALLVLT